MRETVRSLNLGLEDRLDNAIGSLSGGQRQALTLLMATWLEPKLLLLDEHTAALDPKSADQVIHLSSQIISRDRLTTLMVTHSMHQAVNLGDRLIMILTLNANNRVMSDPTGVTGWTVLGTETTAGMASRIYTKVVAAGDAGKSPPPAKKP